MFARWVVVVALIPHLASADPGLVHEDAEQVRPTLKSMTAKRYEPNATGTLVEHGRELRTYNANGRITRVEHVRATRVIVSYDYVWDAGGRMQSRTYRDSTGRKEARVFAWKLDASGRVVEHTMRDPSKDPKEYFRYEYIWNGNAHSEIEYHHVAIGGPHRGGSSTFDASGRLERSCYAGGGCSMYEYDANGNVTRIREQHAGGEHSYRIHESTFDPSGRLVRQVIGGRDSSFTWNARGDVAEIVERQGGTVRAKTIFTYAYR